MVSTHMKNVLVKLDHLHMDRGDNEKHIPNHHLANVWWNWWKISPSENPKKNWGDVYHWIQFTSSAPIGSMYGILYLHLYIYQQKSTIHVGKYTVHPMDGKGFISNPPSHPRSSETTTPSFIGWRIPARRCGLIQPVEMRNGWRVTGDLWDFGV